MSERSAPEPAAEGLYVRRGFLSPLDLTRALAALERLSAKWASSEALGLLGRGRTTQVLATDIAVRTRLDEIGRALAGPTLAWARACGFLLPPSPHIQLFPVRMVGDAERPAYQDPHVDSDSSQAGPPVCTSVFY
ncbi:MAG: hypothetical protein ACREEW_11065, partial [Caulobacteraceae bacterium]